MNEPSSASRTPFIIILILLLAITGVQYLFNFNGLGTDAAMDHAQIARNVARGQGMTTNWLRPIQMVSGSTRAGLNPFLSDAQIHEQEAIRAGQGETLVDPEKFNPYALRDTRNAPLNILTEAAVFRMAGVHKFDLWSMTGPSMIYLPDRIVAGISCMFFILSVLSCYYILLRMFDVTIACFTCLTMILSNLFLQYATSGLPQMMMLFFFAWGIHFLYTALQNKEENRAFLHGQNSYVTVLRQADALLEGKLVCDFPLAKRLCSEVLRDVLNLRGIKNLHIDAVGDSGKV